MIWPKCYHLNCAWWDGFGDRILQETLSNTFSTKRRFYRDPAQLLVWRMAVIEEKPTSEDFGRRAGTNAEGGASANVAANRSYDFWRFILSLPGSPPAIAASPSAALSLVAPSRPVI